MARIKMTSLGWFVTFLCFHLLLSMIHAYEVDYTGDKVYSINVHNDRDWKALQQILDEYTLTTESWKEPRRRGDAAHVHISKEALGDIQIQLKSRGLQYSVLIDDLQKLVKDEEDSIKVANSRKRRDTPDSVSNALIGSYATLDETYTWLRELKMFFGEITEIDSLGQTFEKRNIMIIKVGIPKPYRKPGIFIDAATHSREWISPASINYVIYMLYQGYQKGDAEIVRLLSEVDWYFVPIANPDGYAFSHSKVRLWRKNRAKYPLDPESPICHGVDINRNFPFHWGEVGSSNNPCSVVYRGPSAGSELETQAMMDFLLKYNDTITATLSVHSYSQLFLTRYAYTNSTPPDHDHLLSVNEEIAQAINATNGVWYDFGIAPEILYPYSGGSADWIKDVAGIKYSYTTELRDKGHYGFLLPMSFIPVVAEELWAGLQVLASYASQVPVPQYPSTTREEELSTTEATPTKTSTTRRTNSVSSSSAPINPTYMLHILSILLSSRLLLTYGELSFSLT